MPSALSSDDQRFLELALQQAELGLRQGGIPIGAVLVVDGDVLGVGYNRRVQIGSAIRHGETDALENAGRLPSTIYRKATMYTTLSPCHMCAGAILLYRIPRLVIGENTTFMGAEQLLRSHGVEVICADHEPCKQLLRTYTEVNPRTWAEDIGEEASPSIRAN